MQNEVTTLGLMLARTYAQLEAVAQQLDAVTAERDALVKEKEERLAKAARRTQKVGTKIARPRRGTTRAVAVAQAPRNSV